MFSPFILCFAFILLWAFSQCNKMSCPNCNTLSCYICRQVIKGYDHFNQVSIFAISLWFFILLLSFLRCFREIVIRVRPSSFLFSSYDSLFSSAFNSLIVVWWFCHSHLTSFTVWIVPNRFYERFTVFLISHRPFNLTLIQNFSATWTSNN